MCGAELPHRLPHRNMGRAERLLHPRMMGGHCRLSENKKVVIIIKDGASILDDEPEEELHRGIGQASGSFDKKDGQVVRILREVAEGRPCFLSAVRPAFFKGKKLLVAR